jgi:hypothetical protein
MGMVCGVGDRRCSRNDRVHFVCPVGDLDPVGIGAALGLAAVGTPRGSALGLLSGSGASLLVVAYLQRDGPGMTCWRTATGGGCTQHLDPRPWLVAGIAFALSGIVLHAVMRRPRRPESST